MSVNSVPTAPSQTGAGAALAALAVAALLAVMDGTVVAVALDPLATAFGTPLPTIVWVTIGYLLAAASMLPLLGWAMARFGGRRVFLTGLALFILGSALSVLAQSAGQLVGTRIVQGVGGGLLEPTSLALAGALAPREKVGKVIGAMSMVINVAPVAGPLVGGLLLETGHWQWIFVVNIPLGAAVLVAAVIAIPADSPEADTPTPRPDTVGLALLTAGYVAVLFGLNRSGEGLDWLTLSCTGAGILLLAAYARYALTTSRVAALDLRLLRRPGFPATLAVMGLVGFIMYSQLTSLPVYGLEVHSLTGLGQGLLVSALGLGLLVSMTTAGRLSDRTGPRPLVRRGALVTAAGFGAVALTNDWLPLPAMFAVFVGIGLGFGFTASPTFASVFRTLPAAEHPQGTTALFMSVQLAASAGVTVLGLVHDRAGEHWLSAVFALLTVAALAIATLSVALPGHPE